MSDYQNPNIQSKKGSVSRKLHLCLFSTQQQFTQSIIKLLNQEVYKIECFHLVDELVDFVTSNKEGLDCILLVNDTYTPSILKDLWRLEILLPTVIINAESSLEGTKNNDSLADMAVADVSYHQAEVLLYPTQLREINSYINLAITKFLNLAPESENNSQFKDEIRQKDRVKKSLTSQQRRLTEKIKERLGYLGVFYKRNSNHFYRNLNSEEKQQLNWELSNSYRKILLEYFNENTQINKLIDEFVDRAFFADISTSQILEIHMEIIDDFAHQLQIEGRNDDILLDYRLPLIDITAHLCEIYRRSIPGDDISLELLFRVE